MNINREKRKLREVSSMHKVAVLPTEKTIAALHEQGLVIVHKPKELAKLEREQAERAEVDHAA